MKKIYFFTFILLNLLNSCSSNDDSEKNKLTASFKLSATKVNIGDEIKVTNLSTSSAEIASYTFVFGNNVKSTEKEPTFYYSESGEYTVSLTIIDVNGAASSTSIKVSVTNENSLLVENKNPGGSDTYPLEIGIHDNKIFYTEAIRSVLTSNSSFYRHLEYDDVTRTFTTKVIAQKGINSGHAQTIFLNNGNKIVTFVESINYIGHKEVELNSDWNSIRADNYSYKTIYGSLQNNDQYYFYGSYSQNPAIEIRNSAGQFVSRKTYENTLKNAFIGNLIKTGNTYIAFGGKYDTSQTEAFTNYKPILLFLNENLEITNQKIFETGNLKKVGQSWNNLNGSFIVRKLTNGNLVLYSHNELRITTDQGEQLNVITFQNSDSYIQGLIEVENGFIVSSAYKLEKYDNNGTLIKSVRYQGSGNSGFVKKGDLIYFAAGYGASYENYSLNKAALGAMDSNLNFKKI
ncbi:PKD domain-containing protein [Flavobacterium sp. PS2]|uniref:PKD domain-containing protein n=1 Tax=Flavobacterium sp. PS2 TaxID=3384157 RepID=UPI00390C4597